MGGLLNRVQQAVRHLNPEATPSAPTAHAPADAEALRLQLIREAVELMVMDASLDLESLEMSASLTGLGATAEEIILAVESSEKVQVQDHIVSAKPAAD